MLKCVLIMEEEGGVHQKAGVGKASSHRSFELRIGPVRCGVGSLDF
jgi:hypothetical protein